MNKKVWLKLFIIIVNFSVCHPDPSPNKGYTLSIQTPWNKRRGLLSISTRRIPPGSILSLHFNPYTSDMYKANELIFLKSSKSSELITQPAAYQLCFEFRIKKHINPSKLFRIFDQVIQTIWAEILSKSDTEFGRADDLFQQFMAREKKDYDFYATRAIYEAKINHDFNSINLYINEQIRSQTVKIYQGYYRNIYQKFTIAPDIFDAERADYDDCWNSSYGVLEPDVTGLDVKYQSGSESESEDESPLA